MSVRKREWTTGKGERKAAWVVDYADQDGKRRLKTFQRKKDADAFAASTAVAVSRGEHVADSATVTVAEAGSLWIESCRVAGLERTSIFQYENQLRHHIEPFIGAEKLTRLSVPGIRSLQERLRAEGRSADMVRRVTTSLGSLLADAQERGLVARNVVREMSRRGGGGRRRQKRKLEVGVDIPSPAEIRALVAALEGRWRPLFITAIFTGLRASELRGLRWQDVELDRARLHVRQRADCYREIGRPKSAAGERTVPLTPLVLNTLKEWKLACPAGELVFPNGKGRVENLSNILRRGLRPALEAAGIPNKYGMHAFRHFYASWLINRPEDGGLGLPPKLVQERLGHASITMTMDTYGHLFPAQDDADALAAAESRLLAT